MEVECRLAMDSGRLPLDDLFEDVELAVSQSPPHRAEEAEIMLEVVNDQQDARQ